MNLILQNRTDQHATMHFTWPDGRPGVCNVAARGQSAIPIVGGRAHADAAIPHILDHLARFGVVAAEGADRFDTVRTPHAPPWRGVVYRLDGTP